MVHHPDVENKRKRDSDDQGSPSGLSQQLVLQQQQTTQAHGQTQPQQSQAAPTAGNHISPYQHHLTLHHSHAQHHQPQPQPQPQSQPQSQQQPQQHPHPGFINYLSCSSAEPIALLPSEPDFFNDIIRTLSSYDSVLDRQESFAASLGAKLTGPRLMKGFDKFFEGSIKTNSQTPFTPAITWLDICRFAQANPNEFILTTLPDGPRCCQFVCKGLQVEISEDDWRFINSGALNRIPLEAPLEEDETAELATLDILEQRASVLWKRADEVAARSRIMHHKFGQRRQDILRRRRKQEETAPAGARFQSVNQAAPQSANYDLHADLLQQFLSPPTPLSASRSTSGAGLSQQDQASPSLGATQPQPQQRVSASARSSTAEADPQIDTLRPLITQKMEKLARGDPILPPCDRCRRLRQPCIRHLTACQGCTKKHAKCSWKAVTDEEATRLKREMGVLGAESEADTEMETPDSRLPHEGGIMVGSVASTEGSRPASRSEMEHPHPSSLGQGILHSPGGRIELPPMRMRSNLAQEYGGGSQRAGTPQSQNSVGPGSYGEKERDRYGYGGASGTPSR